MSSNQRLPGDITTGPRAFVRPDGSFDLPRVLEEFADWWIQNGEQLTSTGHYAQAALFSDTHLVTAGPLHLSLPGSATIRLAPALITTAAATMIFRARWPVLRVLGICAGLGLRSVPADLPGT